MYIYPLWRGTDSPYGKGLDYLASTEAKDETSLARAQLAGIKLFILAAIWTVLKDLLDGMVLGLDNGYRRAMGGFSLGIPRPKQMYTQAGSYPVWVCWAAIYIDLFRLVLSHAANGHIIIGMLRLFGFNVFRNTYKPLLSETVVEFWNRYYYYFKELMVQFFFFPTFTRYFKKQPKLRLFAAVFMAAFVGNVYYHLLGLDAALVTRDFAGIWTTMQSRLFYCFLLALGIYVSMLREQKRPKGPRSRWRRAGAIFVVWTFFAMIHIWSQDPIAFVPRMKFFFRLFGVG
jgi:hypothetical protein